MEIQFRSTSSKKPAGVVGKLFTSLFFSVFLGMGLLFCGFICKAFYEVAKTYTWTKTPCIITSSGIADEGKSNRFTVSYKYSIAGKEHTCNTYKHSYDGSGSYSDASALKSRYSKGSKTTCLVDPKEHSKAILVRGSLAVGFFILIPLIFVAVGLGGIIFTWKGEKKNKDGTVKTKSISKKGSTNSKKGIAVFFSIFLIIGFIFTWMLFIRPVYKIIQAKGWIETECLIKSSTVGVHPGDESTTYSVDIFYSYAFNGAGYKSDKYDFSSGNSSGRASKQRVVNLYPAGSKRKCYVNPGRPTEAVLNRDFRAGYLLGLLPSIFFIVGLGGLIYAFRGKRESSDGDLPDWIPVIKFPEPDRNGFTQLKSKASPVAKVIGMIVFTLIFTGAVIGMIYARNSGDGPPLFFIGIFGLVDLAIICGLVHSILALANARPTLTVSRTAIPLGETLGIQWALNGKTSNISSFKISLKGVEEATYRRGTDTCTDHSTFAEYDIVDTTEERKMVSGEVEITIPEDTIHSFHASNNKIKWSLNVHGDIKKWPDIKDEYEILILPGDMS